MIIKRRLIIVLCSIVAMMVALASVQPEVQAQGTLPVTLLAPSDAIRFTSIPYNGPRGGAALGVTITSDWNYYTIDTLAAFQRSCKFVRVYRQTDFGDLILHPSTCSGDVFTFQSVGTAAFIFYSFGSLRATQYAQMDVLWLQRPTPIPDGNPVVANSLLLPSSELRAYLSVPRTRVSGGVALGVMRATDFTAYSSDTLLTFQRSCALVRVYRVTPFGDFILHPSTCAGDVLSFTSVGTGHYIFYAFSSIRAAQNAPVNILWIRTK